MVRAGREATGKYQSRTAVKQKKVSFFFLCVWNEWCLLCFLAIPTVFGSYDLEVGNWLLSKFALIYDVWQPFLWWMSRLAVKVIDRSSMIRWCPQLQGKLEQLDLGKAKRKSRTALASSFAARKHGNDQDFANLLYQLFYNLFLFPIFCLSLRCYVTFILTSFSFVFANMYRRWMFLAQALINFPSSKTILCN